MSGRVEWHGEEGLAHVRALAVQRLTRAAIAVARRAKELLSVPGTAVASGTTSRKKPGAGRKGKG